MSNSPEWIKRALEYSWLNISPDEVDKITSNPLKRHDLESDPIKDVLRLMRKPENFAWTCKYLFNVELPPIQLVILQELWRRPFPMLIASRGAGKSYILSLYAMLRATLCQGVKVVIVGSGFRQAKYLFDYCCSIWRNAPSLRDLVGYTYDKEQGPKVHTDRCTFLLGSSRITALPVGDGSRIRGERANITIGDEFGSQNKEIFETVIGGFGVVQSNPIENMKRFARLEAMREFGVEKATLDGLQSNSKSNQTIISGTADFSFGHFCAYWKRWKTIIESKGNTKKLIEAGIDEDIDWRDYSIIRIPVDLIPGGYFDAKQLARSKATQTIGIYQNEFGAVFSDDSIGFFPMSLINSCVVHENMDRAKLPKDVEMFTPILTGNPDLQYIYGIDPASQRDNFSIFILECRNHHCRVVYGWSTKMSIYKEKVSKGLVKHSTFYGYTARKVRDLMKVFPCNGIAMDSQGGGHAVMEAFNDPQNMEEGELPIWELIDPDKEKPTDDFHGLHIVELVQFSSGEYTGQANHNLKKDMEDKVLLFPEINAIILALSEREDNMDGRLYDTLEDCIYEIEELKRELITITHTRVGVTNRDRWDTPEIKLAGGKKGRMHKDRYSALLMANALARRLMRNPVQVSSPMTGGFARNTVKPKSTKMYVAPDWFTRPGGNPMKTECLGFAVKKGV